MHAPAGTSITSGGSLLLEVPLTTDAVSTRGPTFSLAFKGCCQTAKSSDGQSPSLGNVNKIHQQRTQRATFPRLRCMPLMFTREGVMCCHAIHTAVREGVGFCLSENSYPHRLALFGSIPGSKQGSSAV